MTTANTGPNQGKYQNYGLVLYVVLIPAFVLFSQVSDSLGYLIIGIWTVTGISLLYVMKGCIVSKKMKLATNLFVIITQALFWISFMYYLYGDYSD